MSSCRPTADSSTSTKHQFHLATFHSLIEIKALKSSTGRLAHNGSQKVFMRSDWRDVLCVCCSKGLWNIFCSKCSQIWEHSIHVTKNETWPEERAHPSPEIQAFYCLGKEQSVRLFRLLQAAKIKFLIKLSFYRCDTIENT